jgi:hypothetical protein
LEAFPVTSTGADTRVVADLEASGAVFVDELETTRETIHFTLPVAVRSS